MGPGLGRCVQALAEARRRRHLALALLPAPFGEPQKEVQLSAGVDLAVWAVGSHQLPVVLVRVVLLIMVLLMVVVLLVVVDTLVTVEWRPEATRAAFRHRIGSFQSPPTTKHPAN